MKETRQNGQEHGPIRKPVLVAIGVALMAVVAGIIYMHGGKSTLPAAHEPGGAEGTSVATDEPVLVTNAAQPSASDPAANYNPVNVPLKAGPASAAPTAVQPARPEPSAYTRQLVRNLTDLDLKQGPLTPEKAAEWKQNLQELVKQGAAAVPALQEFFEKNQDLRLDGGGASALGESTLRTAFLKALGTIGGPEALGLQAQVLGTTADPREIALLAAQLDQQAPEQYRQMALEAARAALGMAAAGQLPGRDVGPLFGVIRQFGDPNNVTDLQGATANWRYYGAIALADLPNGAGIPSLVAMAEEAPGAPKGTRNVALQMLAQLAPQSDVAKDALLKQASGGTVPNSTWIEIGAVLSGSNFQIGNPTSDGVLPVSGQRSWHVAQGDQNFYSLPGTTPLTADQINQRVSLIDQLLSGNQNQMAITSLQQAKDSLQKRLPPN